MKQINIRVGKCPFSEDFESTINGVKKPLEETLKLANEMMVLGEDHLITIDGDVYNIQKACFEGDRIIAEAQLEEGYTKLIDIIYCRTDDVATEMFDLYRVKGYGVMQSTVEIETGTHGKHVVKKLEILGK